MPSTLPQSTGALNHARDNALAERVQAVLAASPLMALRGLTAVQADGRIIISGRVSSFYQKQQAQELVRTEAPGLVVVNDVEVG